MLLVAFLGGLGGTAAPPGVSTLGRVAPWLPLVQADAQRYGVPAALELGLIAHESGGDYLATAQDPNGTTDAGLGQINSGPTPADPHWAEFGLKPTPSTRRRTWPPACASSPRTWLRAAATSTPRYTRTTQGRHRRVVNGHDKLDTNGH